MTTARDPLSNQRTRKTSCNNKNEIREKKRKVSRFSSLFFNAPREEKDHLYVNPCFVCVCEVKKEEKEDQRRQSMCLSFDLALLLLLLLFDLALLLECGNDP